MSADSLGFGILCRFEPGAARPLGDGRATVPSIKPGYPAGVGDQGGGVENKPAARILKGLHAGVAQW